MTNSVLLDVVLGLAVLAFLCSRQLRWQVADPTRMWRLPIVLGVIGVISLGHAGHLSPADLTILGLSALAAIGCGLAQGRVAQFRVREQGVVESRGGWAGAAVWLLLIAARVALGFLGAALGSALATSTGMILVTVALSLAAGSLAVSARLPRTALTTAGR